MIFIIKGFRIIFNFIVISTTFRPMCPPAFFRCLSNSRTYTELRTTSFIEVLSGEGQYLHFHSHHPYTVKKGIDRCLQHRAKTTSSDTDAYQEEMISLRHNLHRNNYTERITSAPRNLDWRIGDNTRKLTSVKEVTILEYLKLVPSHG